MLLINSLIMLLLGLSQLLYFCFITCPMSDSVKPRVKPLFHHYSCVPCDYINISE